MKKKITVGRKKKTEKWNILNLGKDIENSTISTSHIEIIGNHTLSIDGCKSILEYENEFIKLKLIKGVLILCGNNFDITLFENSSITVKGEISSIEFSV